MLGVLAWGFLIRVFLLGEVDGGFFGFFFFFRGLSKRICGVVFVETFSVCVGFFWFFLPGRRKNTSVLKQNKTKKAFRNLWGF